ncbi:MAG: hypothetical protein V3T83_02720 [Acidobacteriota bacterium]
MRSKIMKPALLMLTFVGLAFASVGFVAAQSSQEPVVVVPSTPRGPSSAEAARTPQSRRPAPGIRGRFVIPKDSALNIRLDQKLSSRQDESGDEFRGILDEDLRDGNDRVVIPKGSKVVGQLIDVHDAGRVKGRAKMTLELIEVYIGDQAYGVRTSPVKFQAEGSVKKEAKKVGIAVGIGAVIGAIAGGGKGAAVGAAIGGSAGTVGVLVTKGEHVELLKERLLSFRLEEDLEIER